MAVDPAIARYRRWYGRLLTLYPRRFRDRFAEPMAQTFTDLCRERRAADGRLHAFVLGAFGETLAHIMRENVAQLMETRTVIRWGRWVLLTAALLAVPALAMALNVGEVDWGALDFAVAAVLLLSSGLLFEYAGTRVASQAHRLAVAIAVLAGLGLIWVNLAVGMMDVEPGNLMYVLVLFVALVGAAVGRFEPREASIAMFATAAAHAAVAVIALLTGLGPTLLADAFFVLAWVASGLLFRQATLASAPEA